MLVIEFENYRLQLSVEQEDYPVSTAYRGLVIVAAGVDSPFQPVDTALKGFHDCSREGIGVPAVSLCRISPKHIQSIYVLVKYVE